MERPLPTIEFVLGVTGGNQRLVSTAHHGLYEVPLSGLYTNLNLDEVIVFAATSWESRSKDLESFAALVRSGNIYKIFDYVNQIGFPRLNKNKPVPQELRWLYEQLNPYKGRTLEARLNRVDPEAIRTLKEKLQMPVDKYPSKKPYEFADEIAQMLSTYPREYEPLIVVKPRTPRQQIPLPI